MNTQTLRPAIFLDRDGTLNDDIGYLYKYADWRWLEGALGALAIFAGGGYRLVVVTNQSGIARGFYTANDVDILHSLVNDELNQKTSCRIDAFYICPHHPDITGECECRKPRDGMLRLAARELHIDLEKSWMIGDKMSDVQAGLSAGCQVLLVGNVAQQGAGAVRCVQNLLQAVEIIDASNR